MEKAFIKIVPENAALDSSKYAALETRASVEERFLKEVMEFYLGRKPEISDAKLMHIVTTRYSPPSTYILAYDGLPIGYVKYCLLMGVWHFHFVPNKNYKPKR